MLSFGNFSSQETEITQENCQIEVHRPRLATNDKYALLIFYNLKILRRPQFFITFFRFVIIHIFYDFIIPFQTISNPKFFLISIFHYLQLQGDIVLSYSLKTSFKKVLYFHKIKVF